MYKYIIEAVIGYFLGSISFSVIFTKLQYKKDVRAAGSGNAGATNVARVFGMKAGALTLLFDVLKLVIPMALGYYLNGSVGIAVAGIAGLMGHCFPVYFGFKGGKGVSVAATIALFIDWRVFLIGIALFIIIVLTTKIVSISSMVAAVSVPVATVLLLPGDTAKIVLAVVTALLIVFMHRSNIVRIIHGEEPKFKAKSK